MMLGTLGLIAVMLAFSLYTWRVGRDVGGYRAFWRSILAEGPSRQVTLDLYLALAMLAVIMVLDAPSAGVPWPALALYLVLTAVMGSFGPLSYLLHRLLLT